MHKQSPRQLDFQKLFFSDIACGFRSKITGFLASPETAAAATAAALAAEEAGGKKRPRGSGMEAAKAQLRAEQERRKLLALKKSADRGGLAAAQERAGEVGLSLKTVLPESGNVKGLVNHKPKSSDPATGTIFTSWTRPILVMVCTHFRNLAQRKSTACGTPTEGRT